MRLLNDTNSKGDFHRPDITQRAETNSENSTFTEILPSTNALEPLNSIFITLRLWKLTFSKLGTRCLDFTPYTCVGEIAAAQWGNSLNEGKW